MKDEIDPVDFTILRSKELLVALALKEQRKVAAAPSVAVTFSVVNHCAEEPVGNYHFQANQVSLCAQSALTSNM